MLYSGCNRIQLGIFGLLFLTSFMRGGRETAGLIVYQIGSLLLLYHRLHDFNPLKSKIHTPLLAFLFICAFSTAVSMAVRYQGLIYFSTLLLHVSNFYLLLQLRDERFIGKITQLIIFLAVIFSLIIWAQYVFGNTFYVIFPNENLLSAFIACGILLSCAKLQEGNRLRDHPWIVATVLLLLGVQWMLGSRGAWFSFIIGFSFLSLSGGRHAFKLFLLACIVILGYHSVRPNQLESFLSKSLAKNEYTRITIWKSSLNAIKEKPILGWGMGSFGEVYQLKKLPMENEIGQFEKTTRFAHNEFLDTAVQTGLLGLFALLGLCGTILYQGAVRLKTSKSWQTVGAFACILSLLAHSLVDFIFHLPILSFLFIIFTVMILPKPEENDAMPFSNSLAIQRVIKIFIILWIAIDASVFSSHALTLAAEKSHKNKKTEIALIYYKTATILNPFNKKATLALSELSSTEEAEKLLNRLQRFHPGDDSILARLAKLKLEQRNFEQAVRYYQDAIEVNPKFPFHYVELANIYLMLHEVRTAQSLFKKAIGIEPFYCLAHFQLGRTYQLEGNQSLALRHFNNVLKIKEKNFSGDTSYSKRLLEFDLSLLKK